MSAHREENVDAPERLDLLLDCLEAVVADTGMPVLVSTHPRTRKRLDALGRVDRGIAFHEPFGFLDYNKLQKHACCVSPTPARSARSPRCSASRPSRCVTPSSGPRPSTPASIQMTGLDAENVIEAVRFAVSDTDRSSRVPEDYRIGDCSRRAVGFILSTHRRYEAWLGIRGRRDGVS